MSNAPVCPYCRQPAKLITGKELYSAPRYQHGTSARFADRRYWRCDPCDAHVGCERNSDAPLGTLADANLRSARSGLHAAFDPLHTEKHMSRGCAYRALAEALKLSTADTHIARFDMALCRRARSAVVEIWARFHKGETFK